VLRSVLKPRTTSVCWQMGLVVAVVVTAGVVFIRAKEWRWLAMAGKW